MPGRVDVDDAGVRLAGGTLPWVDLEAVDIETTDRGPFEDDVLWRLTARDGTLLLIPSETEGFDVLLSRLQTLPGFDNEAVIRAAASGENAVFACWRRRKVTLREERNGRDFRWLGAYVDGAGNLHIDGQDLGPGTAPESDDGEYEWFKTVAAVDVPRLLTLLGRQPGDDVLDVLAAGWTGLRSYELERLLRESGIPLNLHTWSG